MGKNAKRTKEKSAKRKRPPQAQAADRHVLYQKAVQDPATEIELMVEKFTALRGREPVSLREDFCGTALLSVAWAASKPERTAVGVDLCADTLDWGRRHNLEPAGADVSGRVQLIEGNVLNAEAPPVDLTCAFNFSYNGLRSRSELLEYFRAAHRGLKRDGILVLDVYGGTEAIEAVEEERRIDGEKVTYVWEQERFNPITHETTCHIHFAFRDGSRLDRAFSYEWRLWTLPELRELLAEAGFRRVRVFWEEFEDSDEDDEYLQGTGRYVEVDEVENQQAWIAYVFAEA
jgi:SAM-dependent methyltransferase